MKTTDLPNDCAVTAAVAAWRLMLESGVPSKILMHAHPDQDEGHASVAFETPEGGLLVYDADGSRDLEGLNFHSGALAIARRAFGEKVSAAYFYPGLKGVLGSVSRDRPLSPRERRDHLPNRARLLDLEAPTKIEGRRMSPGECRAVRHCFNNLLMREQER